MIVTLFDEAATLPRARPADGRHARGPRLRARLRRRRLDGRHVGDGRRLHAADPRVRGVRLKRNFGQHPAMHAGLARARGAILVTMDGDLQNQPEDIPKLVAAVEAGADVASGRRVARRDSWGRTLPSRLINAMLRRFTGVAISDFGCAFNAYRREAVEPMLGVDRQAEVHEGARPLRRRERGRGRRRARRARRTASRYSPLRLDADRAARARRASGRRRSRSSASGSGSICTLGAIALGCLRHRLLDRRVELPRPALRRRRRPLRARHPGLPARARRRVPGQNPARRRGPAAVRRSARARLRGGAA